MTDPPARGTRVDRYLVTGPCSSGKHTTVLQARDEDGLFVALKFAVTRVGLELVERESRMLGMLADAQGPVPAFVGAGTAGDRPYRAARWRWGVDARTAAMEAREQTESSEDVLELCRAIARAFADLHCRGAVHGQVHPRHILVDADGSIALLDLSLATTSADAPAPVYHALRFNTLSAPEHAEALLRSEELVPSAAAEQYSIAALLYLVVTGRMYARLRLGRQELASDIIDAPPLPFAEHGLAPWPELETVLARALSKVPAERFASMTELDEALAAARDPRAPGHVAGPDVSAPLTDVLAEFRRNAADVGVADRLDAPTCSVNFGAAGVAFALTRIGATTQDAEAFEHAEHWISWAEDHREDADAFDDGDELTPATVGLVSPYHNASGVAAVRALLSAATGDHQRQQAALDDFCATTEAPCDNLDLTLGRSAVLLFAALLYAQADPVWPATQRLRDHGDEVAEGIWRDLGTMPMTYNGIAHGWAGIAYASLMWTRALGVDPAPGVRPLLDHLSSLAEPSGRGSRWPLTPAGLRSEDEFWPGWCHGNAGYVFLWNLAHATYGDARFAELADRAAWRASELIGVDTLCCGTAGQSYALLNHAHNGGGALWGQQAARLANNAAAAGDSELDDAINPALALYKGRPGLALLAVELGPHARGAMPLFEFEPDHKI